MSKRLFICHAPAQDPARIVTWANLERRLIQLCDLTGPGAKAGIGRAEEALNCLWLLIGQLRHLASQAPEPSDEVVAIMPRQLDRWESIAACVGMADHVLVNGPRGVA